MLKSVVKFFLIHQLFLFSIFFSKITKYTKNQSKIFENFDIKVFEKKMTSFKNNYPFFPYKLENIKDLICLLSKIYLFISTPKFNQPQSDLTIHITSQPSISPIKHIIGKFCMVNLNDLELRFSQLASDLRDLHIPSTFLRSHHSFINFPADALLNQVQDFSNHPLFQIAFCLFLVTQKDFLKANVFLKELVQMQSDVIPKTYLFSH